MLTFIISSIRLCAAFLFGCTGETLTEKTGHLNLGIPGVMCAGAVGGCFGESIYLSSISNVDNINPFLVIFIPFLFSIIFAGLLGLIFSFFTVTLHANQNITGLTITTFGIGFSKFLISTIDTNNLTKASGYFIHLFPFYNKMGVFGELFLSYGVFVYLAIIVAVGTSIFLKKTRIGLNLRAVGESPSTADSAGINVSLYRYVATIVGCAIAGLGGLFFIMDYVGGNWEYCIDMFGWLTLALVIFSIWKPDVGILGSLIFAGLYILPNYVSAQTNVKELIKALPYLVTIIVLIFTSIFGKNNVQPPKSLGVDYFREDR